MSFVSHPHQPAMPPVPTLDNFRRQLVPDPIMKPGAYLGTLLQSGGSRREYCERNGAPSKFANGELVRYLNVNKFHQRDIKTTYHANCQGLLVTPTIRKSSAPQNTTATKRSHENNITKSKTYVYNVKRSKMKDPRMARNAGGGASQLLQRSCPNGQTNSVSNTRLVPADSNLVTEKAAPNCQARTQKKEVSLPTFGETLSERVKTRRRIPAKVDVDVSTSLRCDKDQNLQTPTQRGKVKLTTTETVKTTPSLVAGSGNIKKDHRLATVLPKEQKVTSEASINPAPSAGGKCDVSGTPIEQMLKFGEKVFTDYMQDLDLLKDFSNLSRGETWDSRKLESEHCNKRISHLNSNSALSTDQDFLQTFVSYDVGEILDTVAVATNGESKEHEDRLREHITEYVVDRYKKSTGQKTGSSSIRKPKAQTSTMAKSPKKNILMKKTLKQTMNIRRNIQKNSKQMAHVVESLGLVEDEKKNHRDKNSVIKSKRKPIKPLTLERRSLSDDFGVLDRNASSNHRKRKPDQLEFKIPKKSSNLGAENVANFSCDGKAEKPGSNAKKCRATKSSKVKQQQTKSRQTFERNNLISDSDDEERGLFEKNRNNGKKSSAKNGKEITRDGNLCTKKQQSSSSNTLTKSTVDGRNVDSFVYEESKISKTTEREKQKRIFERNNVISDSEASDTDTASEYESSSSDEEERPVIANKKLPASSEPSLSAIDKLNIKNKFRPMKKVAPKRKNCSTNTVQLSRPIEPSSSLQMGTNCVSEEAGSHKGQFFDRFKASGLAEVQGDSISTISNGKRPDWNGVLTVRMKIVDRLEDDDSAGAVGEDTPPQSPNSSMTEDDLVLNFTNVQSLHSFDAIVDVEEEEMGRCEISPQHESETIDENNFPLSEYEVSPGVRTYESSVSSISVRSQGDVSFNLVSAEGSVASNTVISKDSVPSALYTSKSEVASEVDDCMIVEVEKGFQPISVVYLSDDGSSDDEVVIVEEIVKAPQSNLGNAKTHNAVNPPMEASQVPMPEQNNSGSAAEQESIFVPLVATIDEVQVPMCVIQSSNRPFVTLDTVSVLQTAEVPTYQAQSNNHLMAARKKVGVPSIKGTTVANEGLESNKVQGNNRPIVAQAGISIQDCVAIAKKVSEANAVGDVSEFSRMMDTLALALRARNSNPVLGGRS